MISSSNTSFSRFTYFFCCSFSIFLKFHLYFIPVSGKRRTESYHFFACGYYIIFSHRSCIAVIKLTSVAYTYIAALRFDCKVISITVIYVYIYSTVFTCYIYFVCICLIICVVFDRL